MAGKTKYKPEYDIIAENICRQFGIKDKELAETLSISIATLNNWKKNNSSFLESIKKGKDEHDTDRVEASLNERARGYSHPDVHISNFQGDIIITKITKHYPPDVTACIFWLCNRNRERWKSINANLISEIGENAEQYFKKIADAIKESDTNSD